MWRFSRCHGDPGVAWIPRQRAVIPVGNRFRELCVINRNLQMVTFRIHQQIRVWCVRSKGVCLLQADDPVTSTLQIKHRSPDLRHSLDGSRLGKTHTGDPARLPFRRSPRAGED